MADDKTQGTGMNDVDQDLEERLGNTGQDADADQDSDMTGM